MYSIKTEISLKDKSTAYKLIRADMWHILKRSLPDFS